MASNEIFVSEPIADKPVALGGIGQTLGKRLTDKGFDKVCVSYWYMDFEFYINIWRFAFKLNKIAHLKQIMNHPAWMIEITFYLYNQRLFILFFKVYHLLGQFLLLKKNKFLFEDWLQETAGAMPKQASECFQDLSDWCDQFL